MQHECWFVSRPGHYISSGGSGVATIQELKHMLPVQLRFRLFEMSDIAVNSKMFSEASTMASESCNKAIRYPYNCTVITS
jgi:hypothetical protein